MANAAILKIEKRPCLCNGSTDRHVIWLGDAYWPSKPDGQLKFQLFKIQDGGRPPFWKIGKRPYLRNGSRNQHEIRHVDAYWPSKQVQQLKSPTFWNPRWLTLTRNILATADSVHRSPGKWQDDDIGAIYSAYYFTYKSAKIIKQKLASLSFLCKTASFKQQMSKCYPQILSTEASFYICDKPHKLVCVEFADKILIFAVLKQCLLQLQPVIDFLI